MKKTLAILGVYILGVICHIAYALIGNEVSADGTLVESFYLIPIGWSLYFIGAVLTVLILINRAKLKNKAI